VFEKFYLGASPFEHEADGYKAADIASKIDEAGSFRARRDDGWRDPVCYSAYFVDLSRHPVTTNIFDEKMSWHPGHIELPITPISF